MKKCKSFRAVVFAIFGKKRKILMERKSSQALSRMASYEIHIMNSKEKEQNSDMKRKYPDTIRALHPHKQNLLI